MVGRKPFFCSHYCSYYRVGLRNNAVFVLFFLKICRIKLVPFLCIPACVCVDCSCILELIFLLGEEVIFSQSFFCIIATTSKTLKLDNLLQLKRKKLCVSIFLFLLVNLT